MLSNFAAAATTIPSKEWCLEKFLRVAFAGCFAALLTGPAVSQQTVAPPPKPSDSGRSLPVTMKFIQDKLNGIGKVTYVLSWQNTSDGSAGNAGGLVRAK